MCADMESNKNLNEVISHILFHITPNENAKFCGPIVDSEIDLAVLSAEAFEKAPRPDGFPGVFYQNYWTHVKSLFLLAVHALSFSYALKHHCSEMSNWSTIRNRGHLLSFLLFADDSFPPSIPSAKPNSVIEFYCVLRSTFSPFGWRDFHEKRKESVIISSSITHLDRVFWWELKRKVQTQNILIGSSLFSLYLTKNGEN